MRSEAPSEMTNALQTETHVRQTASNRSASVPLRTRAGRPTGAASGSTETARKKARRYARSTSHIRKVRDKTSTDVAAHNEAPITTIQNRTSGDSRTLD